MELEIEATGVSRIAKRLRETGDRAADPRPVLQDVMDDFRKMQRVQFRTGTGWEGNKESTLRQKQAKGQGSRQMVATGRAERSYTVKGAPGSLARVTRTGARYGSTVYYLRFQKNKPLRITRAVGHRTAERIADFLMEAWQ